VGGFDHCSFLLSVALPSPQTNNPEGAPERLIEPGDVNDFGDHGVPGFERSGGAIPGGSGGCQARGLAETGTETVTEIETGTETETVTETVTETEN
jgi:hypothetical protein